MSKPHMSKFMALAASKCPKCRVGEMFVGSPYGFKRQRMNDVCPHCGLRFEIEPGYFYAAMYVSYGMSVAEVVTIGLLTYQFTRSESPWVYLAVLVGTILVFAPFNFRYSRLILLHYLTPRIKYDPKYEDQLHELP